AAVAAVGTVRAAEWLELLAPDTAAAVSAVAGSDVQHDAVDERGHGFLSNAKERIRNPGPAPAICSGLADRHDVDGLAVTLLAELHGARGECEQRVVATTPDV